MAWVMGEVAGVTGAQARAQDTPAGRERRSVEEL